MLIMGRSRAEKSSGPADVRTGVRSGFVGPTGWVGEHVRWASAHLARVTSERRREWYQHVYVSQRMREYMYRTCYHFLSCNESLYCTQRVWEPKRHYGIHNQCPH